MDLIRHLSPRNIFEFIRKSAPRTVVYSVHHCVSFWSWIVDASFVFALC